MPYCLRDIPKLMDSPAGRRHLLGSLIVNLHPVLVPIAGVFRRLFLKNTRITVVTGSFGKTTTTRVLKAAFLGNPDSRININTESRVALEILSLRPCVKQAILEIGIDRPGRMVKFAWMIKPDIAVVTSVGGEHHPAFGTLENTRNEKAEIVRSLPSSGLAVLNGDDPNVLWMKDQTRARVVTFGFNEENDVRAEAVELHWPQGTNIHIRGLGQNQTLKVGLFGWPMAYAILAGVATALAEGLSLKQFAPHLEVMSPTVGRLQPVALPGGIWLIRDEFKASFETIEAALDLLDEIHASRRILVLGKIFEPMQDQNTLYRQLGTRIAQVADKLVFVGEETQMHSLIAGAVEGGLDEKDIFWVQNVVTEILDSLPHPLVHGDVIFIKGCSEQRLERVALALSGRKVRCTLKECGALISLRCDHCKMLERGWEGKRKM